ncbi:hypothetical protein MMC10_011169 [Thelotrema lepadinum]|nr:hypothetical protein [Thelotrema lepadinum]
MPAPVNTLLIDGSFEELSEELAQYCDDIKKKQGDEASSTRTEIAPLLEQGRQDDALKKLVTNSAALNAAPEKEFIAAYNLLVHLVRHSSDPDKFLARICKNLSQPITSSPYNGTGLALSVLTTIFNIIPQDNEIRFNIFIAILDVVRRSSSFDLIKPQLKKLDSWLKVWDVEEEDQLKLYQQIAELAEESGDRDQAYLYLLRALRTVPPTEAESEEARSLSLRALKSALTDLSHYDFQDLTALDSVQALRKSDPIFFELLEIFNAEQLDEYNDFLEEHDGWIEQQQLDNAILLRKIRLLTLASLAASTQSRSLPYQNISRALQIQSSEVEMWVIDVIRAGLIEGKLSQLNQTFLIHRSTYRVFGEKQWKEVASRLDTWRNSLEGVLGVIRQEREKILREKEREIRDIEGRANGFGGVRQARRIEHSSDLQ